MSPDEIKKQLADQKFDRNLKIVAGVISVLGVAATTVMTIMETEKQVRKSLRRRKTIKVKGPKAKSVKALKAPVKKKMARHRPIINPKQLLQLEKQAEKVLDQAQQLKEELNQEVKNGGVSPQTEK